MKMKKRFLVLIFTSILGGLLISFLHPLDNWSQLLLASFCCILWASFFSLAVCFIKDTD